MRFTPDSLNSNPNKFSDMKYLFIAIGLLMALNCGAKKEPPQNTLSKNEIKDGWKLLFNGKDLEGWKHFNGGEITGWKVEDGILKNSGVGSDAGGDVPTYGIAETGRIGLQDHGGLTLFRNIKIREL
jgi:Domain of Unknown Function (DUF1080)